MIFWHARRRPEIQAELAAVTPASGLAPMTEHCQFQATAQTPRPRLRVLLTITLFVHVLALARSGMDQRIGELRDQSRLSPAQVLPRLLEPQPRVRAEPPLPRAELLVQISMARMRLDQLGAAAGVDQVIAYGTPLRDDLNQLGARHMLGDTLNTLADSYLRERDYVRAAQYATEALGGTKDRNQTGSDATARVNSGHAYLGMGRIAEGKKNFLAGLAWFEQSGSKPDVQETLMEYGRALEEADDTKGAVAAYHRERAISNELFQTKRQQAVLELQERYEADKKQRQIELLGSENRNRRLQQHVWWLLAAVATLAAVVVGLMYRKVRQANAQLQVANQELKLRSSRDPLTGLYNRRHFHEFMTGLGPDPTHPDHSGALFLLDADHFKDVNDRYGHAAGDTVLKTIAEKLRAALRETDMIVRWGGEEFLVFVPSVARDGVDEVARRILTCIASHPIHHQEHDIPVRVSIGYVPFPLAPAGTPLPWERVVNLADMALYLAKTNGRNRACGVRGFDNFERTSMEEIEQGLEGAWNAGFVDLSMVFAPPESAKAGASPQPE